MPRLLQPPGRISDHFDASVLSSYWTAVLGTLATNAGALRASAIAADGHNRASNPEFTTDTAGWGATAGATLTRRDYTVAPDIDPTGGVDDFGLEVANTGTADANANQSPGAIVGATYIAACRAYAPSANTQSLAARLGFGGIATVVVEDAWQALSVLYTPTFATPNLRAYCLGSTAGDLAHFDAASVYLQSAMLTYDAHSPNVRIIASVKMPAAAVTPRAILCRVVDALNGWFIVILPNTATGNDLVVYERVAGVFTARATAAVRWGAPGLLANTGFETAGAGDPDFFGSWSETAGDGAIADDAVVFQAGAHSAKLTAGATANTVVTQTVTVVAAATHTLSLYSRGDGTNAGRYAVYDVTNGVYLIPVTSTGQTAAAWVLLTTNVVLPVNCTSVRVELWCPAANGGIVNFDTTSLKRTSLTDDIRVDIKGPVVTVYSRLAQVNNWVQRAQYSLMTSALTATRHGAQIFAAADDSFDRLDVENL